MIHKITIEIESEKEWSAVCALSSLIEKPLSEIVKDDLISMTKQTADNIKRDSILFEDIKQRNPSLFKMLMDIIK